MQTKPQTGRDSRRPLQRLVGLRGKAKASLRWWTSQMKRAEKDLRSGDEREAREQVHWLKGYLQGTKDAEQANAAGQGRREKDEQHET